MQNVAFIFKVMIFIFIYFYGVDFIQTQCVLYCISSWAADVPAERCLEAAISFDRFIFI